jgi:cysteate synthase
MGDYIIRCPEGEIVEENIHTLTCPFGHKGLLRAEYSAKRLIPREFSGIYKFYDWLPVRSVLATRSAPIAFQSESLSRELGLKNLWIGFTGYYPERGAYTTSCSFKEMEAFPTYSRINDFGGGTVLLASAGNTARAFAQVAGETGCKCVIVVPERSANRLKVTKNNGNARLFTVNGDYTDAIEMSERIAALGGFILEGGAKNVARRDGMGTVLLEGVLTMGRLPDHYFQAVGSGTGAISAWEASIRLLKDGCFGTRLPMLNLSQNLPFVPMQRAWDGGRRDITKEDLGDSTYDAGLLYADVLANRRPPYGIPGGVFDAMSACGGRFFDISDAEAVSAGKLWSSVELVSLDPAANVALASLIRAVEEDLISCEDVIFLNLTGGGMDRAEEDLGLMTILPEAGLKKEMSDEDLRGVVYE